MNAAASDQPPANPPESTTPGELLRRERQRRGISVQQAAEDLHLDVWVVEALEDNRYSALGAPVYSKGYLRKYAALLDLSPEVVLARYESVADRPGTPTPIPIMTSAPPAAPGASLKKPLLILGALIAAALLVWLVRFLLAPPAVAPLVAPPGSENVEPPVESAAAPRAAEETTAEQAQPSVQAPAPATQPPVASAPAPSGPQVRLRLEFTDTSWTEVYDATDRRLMFGLGEAGRIRNVSGVAPLRVTLGAASAVTAYVNDEQIVIPRREGRDASKFVIEADGGVRPGGP
jgi:cytoskeleton protein RodZ